LAPALCFKAWWNTKQEFKSVPNFGMTTLLFALVIQSTALKLSKLTDEQSSNHDQPVYGTYRVTNTTSLGIRTPDDVNFFASSLMSERIQQFMQRIEPEFQAICEKMFLGKPASFSQGWQDWYIYHNYFKDRDWGEGVYMDFGTNDPLTISNTAFFDKCLGWKGVCIEMNPKYHAAIRNKRGCSLVDTCVLGKETEVGFTDAGTSSEVKEDGKGMTCTTLAKVFEQHEIKHVDFVSIDIEGAEADTLRCLDMSRYDVGLWLVETNKQDQHQVDYFFQKNGYANSMSFVNAVKGRGENRENYFIDSLYEKLPRQRPKLPEVAPCDADSRPYMSRWCAPFQTEYRPNGDEDAWVCK